MAEKTQNSYEALFEAYDKGTVVKALVGEVSGNGYQVLVCGLPAYLRDTQIGPGMTVQTGGQVDVCIIKIMPASAGIMVSAKVALQKKFEVDVDTLKVGQIVTAVISNIISYGAFAMIGNASGLIHITELAHKYVQSPADIVTVGQEVKVKIIGIKTQDGQKRFELSLKQATNDTLDNPSLKVGDIVDGTVTKIEDFGVFVSLGSQKGLVYSSDITSDTLEPVITDYVKVGDKVKVRVMNIDQSRNRIKLSIKAAVRTAWDDLNLSEGDVIELEVLGPSPSGASLVVGKQGGVEGVLPRREMAWTKKDCLEYENSVKIGQTIRVVVMDFDAGKHKLIVSRRHLFENPLDVFIREHPVGDVVEGEVIKNAYPGIIKISLPCGDFRINFEPSFAENWDDIVKRFPVGGKLPVKYVAYDPEEKIISFEPVL